MPAFDIWELLTMLRSVWWLLCSVVLESRDDEKLVSRWIGSALLVARQRNPFGFPEILSLSQNSQLER